MSGALSSPPRRLLVVGFGLLARARGRPIVLVACRCRVGHGLVELLLQLLLVVQQAAERQLELTRLRALRFVAEKPPFEQLVFVRQLDDGLAKRRILRFVLSPLGFDPEQLGLQRRDGRGGRRPTVSMRYCRLIRRRARDNVYTSPSGILKSRQRRPVALPQWLSECGGAAPSA